MRRRSRCPDCHADIKITSVVEDIRLLRDPPPHVEPYRRYTRWQCLRCEDHHGEYSEPTSDAPGSSPSRRQL